MDGPNYLSLLGDTLQLTTEEQPSEGAVLILLRRGTLPGVITGLVENPGRSGRGGLQDGALLRHFSPSSWARLGRDRVTTAVVRRRVAGVGVGGGLLIHREQRAPTEELEVGTPPGAGGLDPALELVCPRGSAAGACCSGSRG